MGQGWAKAGTVKKVKAHKDIINVLNMVFPPETSAVFEVKVRHLLELEDWRDSEGCRQVDL